MTPRPGSPRFALFAIAAFLLTVSCSENGPPLAPVGESNDPMSIVAGTVHRGDEAAEEAAVILEPVRDGLPIALWNAIHAEPAEARGSGAGSDADTGGDEPVQRVATTDSAGRFAFADVAPGEYVLRSSIPDHRAGAANIQVIPPIGTDAETTFVDIALVPVGKLFGGALLDMAWNDQHENTIVYVEGTSQVAVTDPVGNYLVEDVPVGTHTLRASHPGWIDATTTVQVIAAGDSIEVDRLVLSPDTNIPPVASAAAAENGNVLQAFTLTGAGSDDDGSIVSYSWDFEDDGVFDVSSTQVSDASHLYPTGGWKRAKLRVTDDRGATNHDAVTFYIHDAYYVTTSGSDSNRGSKTEPFLSIPYAITQSAANGMIPVRVAKGGPAVYTGPIDFVSGVDITGGYDATTWTRAAGDRSVVQSDARSLAVGLSSITVTGLELQRLDNPSGNATALLVKDSDAGVSFVDCKFVGGDAGDGTRPPDGVQGVPSLGGSGGWGSYYCNVSSPGDPGSPGQGPGGGAGGAGGAFGSNGSDGFDGQNGTFGAHGVQNSAGGFVFIDEWYPFTGYDGINGVAGGGGGGGGGAGAHEFFGNCFPGGSGGGGGEGGAYGEGGNGGRGGFASFALLSVDWTAPVATFTNCVFTAGTAGEGGDGSNGAPGGAGWFGESGNDGGTYGLTGGDGGSGGNGGGGGGGAGGSGGWSYGAYVFKLSPTFSGCTFTGGAAGDGGLGGFRGGSLSRAPDGIDGSSGGLIVVP